MDSEQFHKEVATLVVKAMSRYNITSIKLAEYCEVKVGTIHFIRVGIPVNTSDLIKVLSLLNIRLEVKWL